MTLNLISLTINQNELINIIKYNYNIDNIIDCKLLKSGQSDIYKISTNNTYYIVKIYQESFFNKQYLQNILNTLYTLNDYYKNFSNPIHNKNKEFISEINILNIKKLIVVFKYSLGSELKYKSINDSIIYSNNIANFHNICDENEIGNDTLDLFEIHNYTNSIRKTINGFLLKRKRKNDLKFFNKTIDLISNQIENDNNIKDFGFCHLDLHGGNANVIGEHLEFYDFDNSLYAPREYELSVFRWSCLIGKREEYWKSFYKNYKKNRKTNYMNYTKLEYYTVLRDLRVFELDIIKTNFYGENYISPEYISNRIKFQSSLLK
jgi:Ser/Thr protein kinase RdoA (MazF antagonist)